MGLREKVAPAVPAIEPRKGLAPSKPLSIIQSSIGSFEGRKVGVLVTSGSDRGLLDAIRKHVEAKGTTVEIVAPTVGGIGASDGSWIEGDQKIGGGPSVLYDAVVVLPSDAGAAMLAKLPAAKQFAADAFAHLKFIGYTKAVLLLFQKAGIAEDLDEGCIELTDVKSVKAFVSSCRQLRLWEREKALAE